jgi:tRNA (guanine9-N1)-methyltransferase
MEAEERPSKMRKLSHGDKELETPHVQLSQEAERELSEEGVQASSKGEESDAANDADYTDPNDGGPSAREQKVPRPEGMSKSAWKKLQKKAEWEAGREFRKIKRKEKIQAKKARDRAAKADARAPNTAHVAANGTTRKAQRIKHVKLPITFLIDCGFDDLMMEKERISLGSQLTRSYSDNSRAPFQAHLVISSWGGLLKERFDTILAKHYENWKGVVFTDKDFVEAANMAKSVMKGEHGGEMAGVFERYRSVEQPEISSVKDAAHFSSAINGTGGAPGPKSVLSTTPEASLSGRTGASETTNRSPAAESGRVEQIGSSGEQEAEFREPGNGSNTTTDIQGVHQQSINTSASQNGWTPANGQQSVLHSSHTPSQQPDPDGGEIVYLTSDSPYTLDELKPYSTYIIGGLVDKNRHKGICYKIACEKGLKTAKLPIGEFMEMQSRFVLATNHVVEIMVRWLECGDWGKAFLDVIPKRKGGKLKDFEAAEEPAEDDGELGDASESRQPA